MAQKTCPVSSGPALIASCSKLYKKIKTQNKKKKTYLWPTQHVQHHLGLFLLLLPSLLHSRPPTSQYDLLMVVLGHMVGGEPEKTTNESLGLVGGRGGLCGGWKARKTKE